MIFFAKGKTVGRVDSHLGRHMINRIGETPSYERTTARCIRSNR